jgi:hypothetical protein
VKGLPCPGCGASKARSSVAICGFEVNAAHRGRSTAPNATNARCCSSGRGMMADPPNASVRVSILAVLSPRLAASPEGLYRAYWPVEARLADLPTCLIGMKACIDAPLQKSMDDISAKSATFAAVSLRPFRKRMTTRQFSPPERCCQLSRSDSSCLLSRADQVLAVAAADPSDQGASALQRDRDVPAQAGSGRTDQGGAAGIFKIGCAALLKDEKTIFIQPLGLIGIPVAAGVLAGVFPTPIALPPPELASASQLAAPGALRSPPAS